MPPLSQTTNEVTLLRWLVKEGDQVQRGEPVCEVETDKVTMEVESFASGTILQLCSVPDSVVTVGSAIAFIGKPGDPIPTPAESRQTPARERPGPPGDRPAGIKATPLAKKMAEQQHLDVSQVTGTGPGGRITRRDLEAYQQSSPSSTPSLTTTEVKATLLVRHLAEKHKIPVQNVPGTGPGGLVTRDDLERFEQRRAVVISHTAAAEAEAIMLSENQRMVARNLTKSNAEIPQYYVKSTVYTDSLLAWRAQHRLPDGSNISITSLLLHVLAKALRRHPRVNSSFQGDRIMLHNAININCAVAAGDELHAPVITSADMKEIKEIDTELKGLTAKARHGKLDRQDLLGGTFTLTNLGMYAVDEFGAIINPPQAGIMAVGRMEKRMHIDDANRMEIRTACVLTGSFDHRIVNGALGAEFMSTVKQMIEELY